MREFVHRYLGQDPSRRGFLSGMASLGFGATAAKSVLAPLEASERVGIPPDAAAFEGTGGDLVVAQSKAAGVEYLFTNPRLL